VQRLQLNELLPRAQRLASGRARALLAIVGPPGSGKSTLADRVADTVGAAARVVPMDGFHLSNRELRRLHRADRKGAIDTFDGFGYLHLVRRLAADDEDVYAPNFDRTIEEPVAGSILVDHSVRLVICEGNYLLVDREPWNRLRALFTEAWYCDVNEKVRIERLAARHHAHGKSLAEARAWALGSDQINTEVIAPSRARADVVAVWSEE
jgi:pantothenate kinase